MMRGAATGALMQDWAEAGPYVMAALKLLVAMMATVVVAMSLAVLAGTVKNHYMNPEP